MTRLLATDLDGTLVGDPGAMRTLLDMLTVRRDRWLLAYVTGRGLQSALMLARSEGLPEPDAWITDVGTRIVYAAGSEDQDWAETLSVAWDRTGVGIVASWFQVLVPQPADCQGPFKASYYLAPESAGVVLPALQASLEASGFSTHLVYSSARDLDILPAAGGKGEAVRHLAAHFGLTLDLCLTCGDSGNDRSMLCLGGPAVAVGNARPELLADLPASVYRAEACYSAGILEALERFGWTQG